jgi:hypothetical protein
MRPDEPAGEPAAGAAPAGEARAAAALAAAARIGPYFAWSPRQDQPGFSDISEMSDATVLADRVGKARNLLARMGGLRPADLDERVVASTVFLGLASRLVSPPLAAAALTGIVPLAAHLWWKQVPSGPIPITYDDVTAADPGALADVIVGLTGPVLEAFRTRFVLSPQVLWGNVASALGGAHTMITDASPAHAARSAQLVADLLHGEPLAGMATLHHPDPAKNRWFLVRNNCCLYYRIPGGGTCGDCVLVPEESRQRHWQAVLHRG